MVVSVVLRTCVYVCACACAYACLCDVSGVLKVWSCVLRYDCVYVCMCLYVCMHVCVYVCCIFRIGGLVMVVTVCVACMCVCLCVCVYVFCTLRIEGLVLVVNVLQRVCVYLCVHVCMCDVSGVLDVWSWLLKVRLRACVYGRECAFAYACMCVESGVVDV